MSKPDRHALMTAYRRRRQRISGQTPQPDNSEENSQVFLQDLLGSLMVSGEMADLTFKVGDDKAAEIFKVHKLLLAVRSDVFKSMLYGSLKEKQDSIIDIPDIDPVGFRLMLQYIYTDEADFKSPVEAMHTLTAAEKYLIEPLVDICKSYIKSQLNPSNLCSVWAVDQIVFNKYFHNEITSTMKKSAETVLTSAEFYQLGISSITALLWSDEMNVSEMYLFSRLYDWAENFVGEKDANAEIIREMLKPVLSLIRFLTIEPQEFLRQEEKTRIFTVEEKYALLSNMTLIGVVDLPKMFSRCTIKRKK